MSQSLVKHQGIIGATLLVAGCCIGGGMLGLPVVSAAAGFLPSTLVLFLCCFFMISTGLLILEATLWFKEEISLISISKATLGRFGEKLTWGLFLFVFYCLMIAYISGSGKLISDFLSYLLHVKFTPIVGSFIATFFIGILLFLGTSRLTIVNLFLMVGLFVSYALLIGTGVSHIQSENLLHFQWKASLASIPIMLVSFGYHNLVPSLTTFLKRNVMALRLSIILGNLIPLLFYFLWQVVILGIFSPNQHEEILRKSDMAQELLKGVSHSEAVVLFIHLFAFFAIITSFLANALSSLDFLSDGFRIRKTALSRAFLIPIILLPPFLLSISYPHLFLKALSFAGGFATVILFGILPVATIWIGRYRKNQTENQLLPGGKIGLIFVFILALIFLAIEFHSHLFKGAL